jgi:3-hydroxybutyrate dehydrogenase
MAEQVTALETAGSGVTCTAVCPGWVLTPLVQAQVDALGAACGLGPDAAAAALLAEKQPSGRFVTPFDVGALAVFLCTDAGAHMTGECVSIDGGWGAR